MTNLLRALDNGNQDAYEKTDGTSFDSSAIFLYLYESGIAYYVECVFPNITIEHGSIITSAVLRTNTYATHYNINCTIYGEKNTNAQNFTTEQYILERIKTTSNISFVANEVSPISPDISPIIQEIINMPGWASGNNLGIILKGLSGDGRFNSRDRGAGYSAFLDINYSEPSGMKGLSVPDMATMITKV